jgi:hypothetical protein
MISINSAQDRTILFDLLPLRTGGLRGFDLRLQILAVPGQAMYATTRRLVLKGADSLVFVANSAVDRWEENLQSFREMTQNLVSHRLDPSTMPLVLQYNKRDLPDVTDLDVMDRALNGRNVSRIAAVALRGEGVLETFSAILLRTVEEVCKRYSILDARGGQPAPQWTEQAMEGLFGAQSRLPGASPPAAPPPAPRGPSVAAPTRPPAAAPSSEPAPVARPPAPPASEPGPAPAREAEVPTKPVTPVGVNAATPPPPEPPPPIPRPEAPPTHRKVRVAPQPEELARGARPPDTRASETLVESYAEASEQLSAALNDLREERDLARRRLEDLLKVVLAAQDIVAGKPLQLSLERVLERMADVVGVGQAAFLLPQADRPPIAAALRGLPAEPLLRVPTAWKRVAEIAAYEPQPRLHAAADNVDLAQVLDRADPPLAAVLAVPFRTPRGLQAVATLYFTGDATRPSAEKVEHLGEMARALSAALELAVALEAVRGAERAQEMALAGTASLRGLEGVVADLAVVEEGLAEMKLRVGAPPWLQEEVARLAPPLERALGSGRSLLAFGRGELRRETISVEDLLAALGSELVTIQIAPGAQAVAADAPLLRLALRACLELVRGGGEGRAQVRAETAAGNVVLSVLATGARLPAGGSLGLGLARRIAELHGGTLAMQTTSGGSTALVLTLPSA